MVNKDLIEDCTNVAIEVYSAHDEATFGVDGPAMEKAVRAVISTILTEIREPNEVMLNAIAPWHEDWGEYDKASPMQKSFYQVDRLIVRSSWHTLLNASALGEQSE